MEYDWTEDNWGRERCNSNCDIVPVLCGLGSFWSSVVWSSTLVLRQILKAGGKSGENQDDRQLHLMSARGQSGNYI